MEIQQARAFLAVARDGSVSRAADRIGRTQPAVTMAVQGLEKELKIELLERSGRGVRLTPAGERLAARLGPLLEDWQAATADLEETKDGRLRGRVRIGAGEAAILYLLPGPLDAFRRKNPEVELVLRHAPAAEVLEGLRDGSIDVGIRSLPAPPPSEFEFRSAWTSDRVLIARRGSPVLRQRIHVRALAREKFVLPPAGTTTRTLIEGAFAEAGLALRVSIEAGGWEIVKRYVALGFGISVVPAFCVLPADRGLLGSRSVETLFGREVYGAVTRRGRQLSKAALGLVEEFR
jgi:DNA-binding transcriptional LysR family regulator